ncbi:MAG TPA: SLC13 family permease [Gaiellaceae bacterium]|nr:SLC13 family permease [Gaiellaceae bacterium]
MAELILAAVAVGAVTASPRRWWATAVAAAAAVPSAGLAPASLPAELGVALRTALFLASALTLAAATVRSGLVPWLAQRLLAGACKRAAVLYAEICLLTAALTLAISLDGAVVLVAPLLTELRRRAGAPLAPLLLGCVAVANGLSAAVPQANPTNLVLMHGLDLGTGAFVRALGLPSLAAAAGGALAVALAARRSLARPLQVPGSAAAARPRAAVLAALALAAAGAALAPLAGVSPVWPLALVAAAASARTRTRPAVPVRVALQVWALLAALAPLAPRVDVPRVGLAAVTVAVSAAAALGSNLPVSAAVATLAPGRPDAFGAVLGASAGALATPHGSVATLLALELADPHARLRIRPALAAASVAAVLPGLLVLELTA